MATTAVLFDLDDTLFDHWACTRVALADLHRRSPALGRLPAERIEAEHRRLLEDLHVHVLAGRLTVDDARIERFRQLFSFAGEVVEADAAREAAAAYRAAYLAHWRPVDGAIPLLSALHGRVAIGVVTNNVAAEQRQKIAACRLEPFLGAVVISEEAGVAKPDPRIFRVALDRLGRRAGEAVMLGDAWDTDIIGARAAGMRPIWFNRFGARSPDASVTEVHSLAPLSPVLSAIFPGETFSDEPALGGPRTRRVEGRIPSPGPRTPNPGGP